MWQKTLNDIINQLTNEDPNNQRNIYSQWQLPFLDASRSFDRTGFVLCWILFTFNCLLPHAGTGTCEAKVQAGPRASKRGLKKKTQ
jgi:hypothetical protein